MKSFTEQSFLNFTGLFSFRNKQYEPVRTAPENALEESVLEKLNIQDIVGETCNSGNIKILYVLGADLVTQSVTI